ncbi:MAG: SRPBCC family protein [Rhodospirillales bacterium]
MRAVRYLNWRINRLVSLEDKALIERVQHGMASRSYTVGPLGDSEVSLKSFGRRMRELIPQAALHRPPFPGLVPQQLSRAFAPRVIRSRLTGSGPTAPEGCRGQSPWPSYDHQEFPRGIEQGCDHSGGHNGLVCAFYLARAGMRVTVCERRGVVAAPR